MKTSTTSSVKLSVLLFVAALSLFSTRAEAFTNYPSIGVKMNCTGSKLAVAPALTIGYSFENVELDLGTNFQLCDSRLVGCQGNVMWYMVAPTRKVRLGFFAGVRYFHNASLNASSVAQEKWVQPESKINFDELRLRCIEEQAGFGLKVNHSQHISTFYGIALGAYQTLGETAEYEGMHREVQQADLSLTFSLSYSFR